MAKGHTLNLYPSDTPNVSSTYSLISDFGVITISGWSEGDSVCIERRVSLNECDFKWVPYAPTSCGQEVFSYPQTNVFIAIPGDYRLVFKNEDDEHLTNPDWFEELCVIGDKVSSNVDLSIYLKGSDMSCCAPGIADIKAMIEMCLAGNPDLNTTNLSMTYDPDTGVLTLTDSDGNEVGTTIIAQGGTDTNTTNDTIAFDPLTGELTLTDSDGNLVTTSIPLTVDTNTTNQSVSFDALTGEFIITDSDGNQLNATFPVVTDTNTISDTIVFDPLTGDLTLTDTDGNIFVTNISTVNTDTNTTNSSITFDPLTGELTLTDSDGNVVITTIATGTTDTNTTNASIVFDPLTGELTLTDSDGNVVVTTIVTGGVDTDTRLTNPRIVDVDPVDGIDQIVFDVIDINGNITGTESVDVVDSTELPDIDTDTDTFWVPSNNPDGTTTFTENTIAGPTGVTVVTSLFVDTNTQNTVTSNDGSVLVTITANPDGTSNYDLSVTPASVTGFVVDAVFLTNNPTAVDVFGNPLVEGDSYQIFTDSDGVDHYTPIDLSVDASRYTCIDSDPNGAAEVPPSTTDFDVYFDDYMGLAFFNCDGVWVSSARDFAGVRADGDTFDVDGVVGTVDSSDPTTWGPIPIPYTLMKVVDASGTIVGFIARDPLTNISTACPLGASGGCPPTWNCVSSGGGTGPIDTIVFYPNVTGNIEYLHAVNDIGDPATNTNWVSLATPYSVSVGTDAAFLTEGGKVRVDGCVYNVSPCVEQADVQFLSTRVGSTWGGCILDFWKFSTNYLINEIPNTSNAGGGAQIGYPIVTVTNTSSKPQKFKIEGLLNVHKRIELNLGNLTDGDPITLPQNQYSAGGATVSPEGNRYDLNAWDIEMRLGNLNDAAIMEDMRSSQTSTWNSLFEYVGSSNGVGQDLPEVCTDRWRMGAFAERDTDNNGLSFRGDDYANLKTDLEVVIAPGATETYTIRGILRSPYHGENLVNSQYARGFRFHFSMFLKAELV